MYSQIYFENQPPEITNSKKDLYNCSWNGPTKDRKGPMPPKRTEKNFQAPKRTFIALFSRFWKTIMSSQIYFGNQPPEITNSKKDLYNCSWNGPTKDRKGPMPPKRTEKNFRAPKRTFICHVQELSISSWY